MAGPDPQKQEKMAEAYKRGILPPDVAAKYEEAQKRGLVGADVLSEGGPGVLKQLDNRAVGAVAAATSSIPFYDEYTGGVNAAASAAYNAPGIIVDLFTQGSTDKHHRIADAYDGQVQNQRAAVEFAEENYPLQTQLIRGTAYGAQGVGAAKAFPALIPAEGANTAVNVAKTAAAGSAEGALWAALDGFAGEGSFAERMNDATEAGVWGAALGGPLGVGFRYSIPALQATFGKSVDRQSADLILEMFSEQASVRPQSAKALRSILNRSGLSGEAIDRGLININNRLNLAVESGERLPLLARAVAEEFEDSAPQVTDNIRKVLQQLQSAPAKQGNSAQVISKALNEQAESQAPYMRGVLDDTLGSQSVDDTIKDIEVERKMIGGERDEARAAAESLKSGNVALRPMQDWAADYSDDVTVRRHLRAAARKIGFKGKGEIEKALSEKPHELLEEFQTIVFKRGSDDTVSMQARDEAIELLNRFYGHTRDETGRFASKPGAFSETSRAFRETFKDDEVLAEALGSMSRARDPIAAAKLVRYFQKLPSERQELVRTALKNDIGKMLRGGNVDESMPYLTNLRKMGIHDVLTTILGEDGKRISRAISDLAEEQAFLKTVDARRGQPVSKSAADEARGLYTANPVARMGDNIPSTAQFLDAGFVGSGNLPWVSLAKYGSRILRPRGVTREGLAELLMTQPAPSNAFDAALPPPSPPSSGPAPAPVTSLRVGPTTPAITSSQLPRTSAPWPANQPGPSMADAVSPQPTLTRDLDYSPEPKGPEAKQSDQIPVAPETVDKPRENAPARPAAIEYEPEGVLERIDPDGVLIKALMAAGILGTGYAAQKYIGHERGQRADRDRGVQAVRNVRDQVSQNVQIVFDNILAQQAPAPSVKPEDISNDALRSQRTSKAAQDTAEWRLRWQQREDEKEGRTYATP
ncbi:MAG: hypothetical protein AAGF20_00060 [Pseudomonadota bacterium]